MTGYADGGWVRGPEDTGEGYRMEDSIPFMIHPGETWITAKAAREVGLEVIKKIFPNSTVHIVEELLSSDEMDDQDRPETPGGHT